MTAHIGPDAARYLYLASGRQVPRPFHLRFLLPWLLTAELKAWWVAYLISWPLLAGGMFGWCMASGLGWQRATAATVLLSTLPGILGPPVVIPVGVDLPASAVAVCSVAALASGQPHLYVIAVIAILIAGGIKESTPVFAALWAWNPLLLVGLLVPAIRHLYAVKRHRIGPDPLGPDFQEIADHPIRAALKAHRGRWRDGWLMVAPWGITLAALHGADYRLLIVLGVAYMQLLVATDTVRLVQHAAGPAMAMTAASVLPVAWLPLACVAGGFWFWQMERV